MHLAQGVIPTDLIPLRDWAKHVWWDVEAQLVASEITNEAANMLNPTVTQLQKAIKEVDAHFLYKVSAVETIKRNLEMYRIDAIELQNAFKKRNRKMHRPARNKDAADSLAEDTQGDTLGADDNTQAHC